MSRREEYAIRISGLADGNHDFSFELDKTFFSNLDQSLVETGEVNADIILEKKPGVFSLHFSLKGSVEVTCDRCLEPFMCPIESQQSVYVKLGDEAAELEDDVIMIHKDDHEIGVGQLLYEFIVLALPYRKIHPETDKGEAGCDPEMIRKLNDHLGRQKEENENTDPRWDALKGISNNTE